MIKMKTGKLYEYKNLLKQYGWQQKRRALPAVLSAFLLLLFIAAAAVLMDRQKALSFSDRSEPESEAESAAETEVSKAVPTAERTAAAATPGTAPVAESYYDDACFIGDSRSEGFMQYSGPAKATYYVYQGLSVDGVFNKAFIREGSGKITVADALQKHSFGKVYIMLGINELGWKYSSVFYDKYGKLIDLIQSTQPRAKIFVQSIFPVTDARSAQGDAVNNQKIQEFNTLIQQLCAERRLCYLNIGEALLDENGKLPDEAAYDGVHLKKPYCDKWRAYLDTHTEVPVASMPTTTAVTSGTAAAADETAASAE